MPKNVSSGQLREVYAGDNRRILIDALNDATVICDNYPVDAVFTAEFDCVGATKMLFETETFIGKSKILLNGKELEPKSFENTVVYDFKNLVADVSGVMKDGKNLLEVVFEKATETDGIIGEIYFY